MRRYYSVFHPTKNRSCKRTVFCFKALKALFCKRENRKPIDNPTGLSALVYYLQEVKK